MRILITSANYPSYRIHFDALVQGSPHKWKGAEFHYQPDGGGYDAWIVWQSNLGLAETTSLDCPPTRTLLVLREPPDILTLPADYVKQFAGILGPDSRYRRPDTFFQQFGQVWHVEKTWQELVDCPPPEKRGWISAVTSSKAGTAGQKRRLRLLEDLKAHFKDRLVHFGRGHNETLSKWDAILPFRYHLALENGSWPHYWTEKLCDAYLGWSYPLYVGCPNLGEYFEKDSYLRLNPDDPQGSIQAIERLIESDGYENAIPLVERSRNKILKEFHFYPTILRCLNALPASNCKKVVLRPHREYHFSFAQRFSMRLRNIRKKLPGSGELPHSRV
jgi:hypothetical protein